MNNQKLQKPLGFFSLRWKLLIGFTLLFSAVFAAAYYWFYDFATKQAINRIQEDLTATVQGAAGGLPQAALLALAADPGEPNAIGQAWLAVAIAEDEETTDANALREAASANFGQPVQGGFSENPDYVTLLNWLETVHSVEPRAWPYIYIAGEGEREITYLADVWVRYDPAKAVPFLFTRTSTRSYNGLSNFIFRTDENGNFTTYTDDFGRWVSAYTPIKDATGNSIGAVGVDFEADYVDQVQGAIINQVFIAFGITYVTLFALVFVISGAFTRPVMALTRAAERIGEGDYEQNLTGLSNSRFPDEIGTLARVFTIMVDKVYQREQTLRRQVEELKIEIDEVKRQKQVSEIVDSDFFQDLQARAREMRQRGRRGGATSGEATSGDSQAA